MKYSIMLKDQLVASIENFTATILQPKLLPFDLYEDEYFQVWFCNMFNFHDWCAERLLSLDKYDPAIIRKFSTSDDIYNKTNLALSRNCISELDDYWIRKDGYYKQKVTWEDILILKNQLLGG